MRKTNLKYMKAKKSQICIDIAFFEIEQTSHDFIDKPFLWCCSVLTEVKWKATFPE